MNRVQFKILLAAVVLFAIVSDSDAQNRQFPNSPRGQALRYLVEAIESKEAVGRSEFVEKRLTSDLQAAFTRQEWNRRIEDIQYHLPNLGVRELVPVGQSGLLATLYSREKPHEVKVSMELDSGLISALEFEKRTLENGPLSSDQFSTDVIDFVQSFVDDDEFSGGIRIEKGGEPIAEQYWGYPVRGEDSGFNADTRFNVASMGKMFTAVAIGQLVESGQLQWTDTVGKLYPEFPWPEYSDKITIAHLLSHRSGLGNYTFAHGETSVEGIVNAASSVPISFEPGSSMGYSNTGYAVLGVLIERVTGTSYFDYIRENVFRKAGMDRSGFFSSKHITDNMAVGYTSRAPGSTDRATRVSNSDLIELMGSPGGGGYSTANDMMAFSKALLDGDLISPETRDRLWTPSATSGQGAHYGFGFGMSNRDGVAYVGHNGGGPGIGTEFKIFPDLGITAVIFTNYDSTPIMPISSELIRLISRLED